MKTKNLPGVIAKTPTLAFFLWIICSFAYGTNITMAPDEIRFDYDNASYTFDALTIRNATGGTAYVPEWYPFDGRNNPVAYIKGQMNRKIEVRFSSNYSGTVHLILKLSIFSGNGIGTICNLFIPNYDTSSADYRTLNLSGTLPNIVRKQTFTWKWEIYAIPVNATGFCAAWTTTNTTHTYYTVLAAPQTPMAQPWVSVLDYACTWANGQSTTTGTIQKVVEGLYNRPEFKYHIYGGSSRYTGSTTQNFNLTLMLSDFGSSDINVNCYDMGKSVNIFSNAIGCNSNYMFTYPFGYLNCIKPIGRSWTNNPFYVLLYSPYNIPIVGEDLSYPNRTPFERHAFCMLENIIYDACLKVDTDSNPDSNINPNSPPHVESWAIGWTWVNYKNKVIDNIPSSTPGSPTPYTYSVY